MTRVENFIFYHDYKIYIFIKSLDLNLILLNKVFLFILFILLESVKVFCAAASFLLLSLFYFNSIRFHTK